MKWLDLVMVVLGIASLVGSLVAMYVLASIGDAINALAGFDTTQLGPGVDVSGLVGTLQLFLALGWAWSFAVLLTSLYAVYVGINRLRAGGKK